MECSSLTWSCKENHPEKDSRTSRLTAGAHMIIGMAARETSSENDEETSAEAPQAQAIAAMKMQAESAFDTPLFRSDCSAKKPDCEIAKMARAARGEALRNAPEK